VPLGDLLKQFVEGSFVAGVEVPLEDLVAGDDVWLDASRAGHLVEHLAGGGDVPGGDEGLEQDVVGDESRLDG
jgi:hypothetical protein